MCIHMYAQVCISVYICIQSCTFVYICIFDFHLQTCNFISNIPKENTKINKQ